MQTVIIGAGLAGLCAAQDVPDAVVLEKTEVPGGLCTSYRDGEFTFDFTGHLWHFTDTLVKERVAEWLGSELVQHTRRAGVWFKQKLRPYPFQLALYHLPEDVATEIIIGVLRARQEYQGTGRDGTLAELSLSRFGSGFTNHFLEPYLGKLLGTDIAEVMGAPMARFIPQPSYKEIMRSYLEPAHYTGYNATFFYPRGGNIRLIESLASRVRDLRCDSEVISIDPENRTVTTAQTTISYERLIVTAPLPDIAKMTRGLPEELRKAAGELRAAEVIDVNLGVAGKAPYDLHWSYFPEKEFPFYRVGCYTNFAPELAPPQTYSLYVEIPAAWWDSGDDDERNSAIRQALIGCGWLRSEDDVITTSVRRLAPAYVVPTPASVTARAQLLEYYQAQGIELLGRFARWEYLAMDDVVTAAGVEGKNR